MSAEPLKIEYVKTSELWEYGNNSRTHTEEQIDQVVASIKRFGWTNPIILDGDNTILAGHCRLKAARKLGMTTVPCVHVAHLSEAQRKAYVIADNKLATNAGWNTDILKAELLDLQQAEFDLDVIGFTGVELDNIFGVIAEEEEGEEGEAKAKTYTVVVECDSEEHQSSLLDRLEADGLKCRPVVA
jgi:ParB-like nuclease domain